MNINELCQGLNVNAVTAAQKRKDVYSIVKEFEPYLLEKINKWMMENYKEKWKSITYVLEIFCILMGLDKHCRVY